MSVSFVFHSTTVTCGLSVVSGLCFFLLLSAPNYLLVLLCAFFLAIVLSTRTIATMIPPPGIFIFPVISPSLRIHFTISPLLRILLFYNGLIPLLFRFLSPLLLSSRVLLHFGQASFYLHSCHVYASCDFH